MSGAREPRARVRVLGMGNVLMGDDALGPWVIEYLNATFVFPPEVALVDVGTPGLDLTPYLAGADAIVLVDTVKARGEPGELRLWRKEHLVTAAPGPRLSPHDPGVHETLQLLELTGDGPEEVLLVGVIPASTAMGVGLSPAVKASVAAAADLVLLELARLGLTPARRQPRVAVEPWWETEAVA